MLGLQGIARCQPAPHSAEEAGVRLSANDIKLKFATESQGDEATAGTPQAIHGDVQPLGNFVCETEEASELQAQMDRGDAGVTHAHAALEARPSETDIKLDVQPTDLHGEVVGNSYTEGEEYDKGHILDRSVAQMEALEASSSASDAKLVTMPASQDD